MAKLLLVRHGDTALNSAKRFWGQTDVELSDAGLKQAEMLIELVHAEARLEIDYFHLKCQPNGVEPPDCVPGGLLIYKYHDLDADGNYDEGEPGLDGWDFYFRRLKNYHLAYDYCLRKDEAPHPITLHTFSKHQ